MADAENIEPIIIEQSWGLPLGSKWRGTFDLGVFSVPKLIARDHDTRTMPPLPRNRSALVNHIGLHSKMWNSATRKLVNEGLVVFLRLQESMKGSGTSTRPKKQILIRTSKEYRAILRACTWSLAEMADNKSQHGIQAQYEVFRMMELVWHLVEILAIESNPGSTILPYLLDWIQLHSPKVNRLVRDVADSPAPDRHPDYWSAVKMLILYGKVEDARNLLMQHPARKSGTHDAFSSLDELLKRMPHFHVDATVLVSDYMIKWQRWRFECSARQDRGDFTGQPHIRQIVQVLCGEEEAFDELKGLCDTWYIRMVVQLMFRDPTVKAVDLQYQVPPFDDSSLLDDILCAALQYNWQEVLNLASSCTGNWWMVAHLTDLLYLGGQLEAFRVEYGSDLREFLLLEYASSLMQHQSLWQVSAEYFSYCLEYGKHYLEVLLDHVPMETEVKAMKILHLCQKFDLPKQAQSVCKNMAMRALLNQQLGSALSWSIKSKDPSLAAGVADRILKHYTESGCFIGLDLVDHLGPDMLINDKLIFLSKYREFHRLYKETTFKEAGKLLVALLGSKLPPRRFWVVLLLDALPLLEIDEVIFDQQQTFELLQCLEEDGVASTEGKDIEDQIELLRLALARNLAKAALNEENEST